MLPGRTTALSLVFLLLTLPVTSFAKYTYLGNVTGPLVTIDPVVPGQVFNLWKPEEVEKGRWAVGTSADFLRNADNSRDIDIILSVTGAYSLSDQLMMGAIFPYIIRDPEFNNSDFLDMKVFARYKFTGKSTDSGLGVQLLASFPTAAQGGSAPLTLDTTLLKLSFAVSGTVTKWDFGLNLGYQSYLESESGDDSDLFYGAYAGGKISPRITGIIEYSASRHTHSGDPMEEKITEATALIGVKYQTSESLTLGLGIGSGLADSYADLKTQATLVWVPGGTKTSQVSTEMEMAGEKAPEQIFIPQPPRILGADLIAAIKPGKGDVLIQVSNRSGIKRLGQKVARHLEKTGYVVPVVEEGTGDKWDDSIIYYTRKKADHATEIAGMLADPGAITPARYKLKSVDILLVIGKDLADWGP